MNKIHSSSGSELDLSIRKDIEYEWVMSLIDVQGIFAPKLYSEFRHLVKSFLHIGSTAHNLEQKVT